MCEIMNGLNYSVASNQGKSYSIEIDSRHQLVLLKHGTINKLTKTVDLIFYDLRRISLYVCIYFSSVRKAFLCNN